MYLCPELLKTNSPERKFFVVIGILQSFSIIKTDSTVISLLLVKADFSFQVMQPSLDVYAATSLLLMSHLPVPGAAFTLVLI